MEDKLKVISQIFDLLDPDDITTRWYFSGHPEQGQFVGTGPMGYGLSLRMVGYCVQVRLGRGGHGSHQVFLRHADGELVAHINQGFFALTPAQEVLARSIYEHAPEDEDYAGGYRCCDKIHEVGFLIQKPSPA